MCRIEKKLRHIRLWALIAFVLGTMCIVLGLVEIYHPLYFYITGVLFIVVAIFIAQSISFKKELGDEWLIFCLDVAGLRLDIDLPHSEKQISEFLSYYYSLPPDQVIGLTRDLENKFIEFSFLFKCKEKYENYKWKFLLKGKFKIYETC